MLDREGHDAVDADGREDEGYGGKGGKERGGEAVARERFIDELIHGANLVEGQIGIQRLNRGGDAGGVAHGDTRAGPGALRERNINFGVSFAANAGIVDVAIDANNLPFDLRTYPADARDQLPDEDTLLQWINIG